MIQETKITNLPDGIEYEIGRGTSDNPGINLFTGPPENDVVAPTTGVDFLFVVSRILLDSATNLDPTTNDNILLVCSTANTKITVTNEALGLAEIQIAAIDTSDPNNPNVASRFIDDQPYPFLVLASNNAGENRVIARGRFIVRAIV